MEKNVILELENITKIYPGVVALDSVNFQLREGEVHVLSGENGAGKSTLIKILSGAEQPDYGSIIYQGKKRSFKYAYEAQRAGIATIYQEFNLIPELSIAQNIYLGREPKKLLGTFIDWKKVEKQAQALFDMLGVKIDVKTKVVNLPVSKQQMVEIAKALSLDSKVIIFDEPTSTLTDDDIVKLFEIIKRLREKKIGIIYISHRLEELFEIGDRVTVLRDGKKTGHHNIKDIDMSKIITEMVGRKIDKQFARDLQKPGKEVLKVEGFTSKGVFSNINFSVREREIVGFSGLVGSGRTEVMRAVFGIDKFDSGSLHFYGNKVEKSDPLKSVKLKLAFIPEDRKSEGTCLNLNIRDNIILASMASIFKSGIINLHEEKKLVTQAIKDLDIKTPSMQQKVKFLSGGNQQKVVLAKWLLTKSKIFIFDEPTRGIDVGAKAEFHKLINLLVKEGAGVIMISSEMPEVIGMSDRIFVMKEGTIVQEFSREEASQEKILKAAIG